MCRQKKWGRGRRLVLSHVSTSVCSYAYPSATPMGAQNTPCSIQSIMEDAGLSKRRYKVVDLEAQSSSCEAECKVKHVHR